jgi:hypothetical protein
MEAIMLRVTLSNNAPTAAPMGKLMADSIFTINDDLTYDRPKDRSLAPVQQYEFLTAAPAVRSRRQTDGHMSWMATVVPKVDELVIAAAQRHHALRAHLRECVG